MPFVGQHYKIGYLDSFKDGLLDVLFSADLTKLDIIGYVFKGSDTLDDSRIHHYQVRSIKISTDPPMPIMADDNEIGEGMVEIKVWKSALNILVKSHESNLILNSEESLEKSKG